MSSKATYMRALSGVGGNLVAVQASRLSTSLHFRAKPGELPEGAVQGCPNPCRVFCNRGMNPAKVFKSQKKNLFMCLGLYYF